MLSRICNSPASLCFGYVNFLLVREQLNRANFLQVDRQRFVVGGSFRFYRFISRAIGQLSRRWLDGVDIKLFFLRRDFLNRIFPGIQDEQRSSREKRTEDPSFTPRGMRTTGGALIDLMRNKYATHPEGRFPLESPRRSSCCADRTSIVSVVSATGRTTRTLQMSIRRIKSGKWHRHCSNCESPTYFC